MGKLAAVDRQRDWEKTDAPPGGAPAVDEATAARMVARVRLMMIVAGLTTLIAIAAVAGVIGYRVFRAGAGGAASAVSATVTVPKGARVVSSAVADDRLVVTFDVGGATEIRTFDIRTLKETGRMRFVTAP